MSEGLHSSTKPRLVGGNYKRRGGLPFCAFWNPDRLTELANLIASEGFDAASEHFKKSPKAMKVICAKYGVTPTGQYDPPPEPPSTARTVRCLGPEPTSHTFLSQDPRYERICKNCRDAGVFRAFR